MRANSKHENQRSTTIPKDHLSPAPWTAAQLLCTEGPCETGGSRSFLLSETKLTFLFRVSCFTTQYVNYTHHVRWKLLPDLDKLIRNFQ